jgi:hypothetical protein
MLRPGSLLADGGGFERGEKEVKGGEQKERGGRTRKFPWGERVRSQGIVRRLRQAVVGSIRYPNRAIPSGSFNRLPVAGLSPLTFAKALNDGQMAGEHVSIA